MIEFISFAALALKVSIGQTSVINHHTQQMEGVQYITIQAFLGKIQINRQIFKTACFRLGMKILWVIMAYDYELPLFIASHFILYCTLQNEEIMFRFLLKFYSKWCDLT